MQASYTADGGEVANDGLTDSGGERAAMEIGKCAEELVEQCRTHMQSEIPSGELMAGLRSIMGAENRQGGREALGQKKQIGM